jgi:oligopeptide transport system substrate-binding protein
MNFLKLFFCVFVFIGCSTSDKGAPRKPSKQKISINIENEPKTLDPRKVRSLNDINLSKTFMEGLFRINQNGDLCFGIAEKYEVSEDKKKYTFYLKDTKWSNGDPLRASDFVYAWKKTISKDFPSDYAFLLYTIKNAKSIKGGFLPTNMLGVFAKDDYKLEITLEKPIPYFLNLLTLPIFFPVNEKVDLTKPDWALNPKNFVGNGPFLPSAWTLGDSIVAKKNEAYWDNKAVKLMQIEMYMVSAETAIKMYEAKQLDWAGSPFSQIPQDVLLSEDSSLGIKKSPFLGTYLIRANVFQKALQSMNLRKALALAINRNEIVNHITKAYEPATGLVPKIMKLQENPYFEDGNKEEARKFLRKAMDEEKITKKAISEIKLTYSYDTKNHRIAQAIQDQWKKNLNLDIQIESLEPSICLDKISKGDFHLAIGSWIADFSDPINFLEVFKSKTVGTNNTGWESLNYQKALESTYLTTETKERYEILKKSEEILMHEMPIIPIFHYTMLHVNNERLKNVVLTESGHIDFKWAYVEK